MIRILRNRYIKPIKETIKTDLPESFAKMILRNGQELSTREIANRWWVPPERQA